MVRAIGKPRNNFSLGRGMHQMMLREKWGQRHRIQVGGFTKERLPGEGNSWVESQK